jgi:alkanesulfonate monooxygenase SsuD/methylene tetrahydromethanopterin reductase-like flavin-dependent oxidoreductase (luciferase family)
MGFDEVPTTFGALVLPNEPWDDLTKRWARLDAGGLDAVWSCDHFTNPHAPGQPWFEASVTLAGLAQATSRARVGLLVGAIVSRAPTLFAKQAQAIDHMSDGRLIVGLGAGGGAADQRMWGACEWSDVERVARFAEYVELVDRLLREDEVDFEGQWYRTNGALLTPGCVQRPRPPILLAGHGPRSMRVVARFAEIWNTFGPTLADAVDGARRLDAACQDIGRDPVEVRRSVLFGIRAETAWRDAGEFADLVRRWYDAGFRDFVFYDPPYRGSGLPTAPPETVEELLHTTIPTLRDELG